MQPLVRSGLLIALVLLVPIVPFVLFGEQLEQRVGEWLEQDRSRAWIGVAVASLLATDILLPIPSSMVSTLAGMWLGTLGGAAASWLGMTAGAAGGYWLTRWFGVPLARWIAGREQLERAARVVDRHGPTALVLMRGVPVLAEASVLLVALHGLAWWRFIVPVALANLALAFGYAAIGDVAERHRWSGLALAASIVLPVLMALVVQRWVEPRREERATAGRADDESGAGVSRCAGRRGPDDR